jgi:hypothetical protein
MVLPLTLRGIPKNGRDGIGRSFCHAATWAAPAGIGTSGADLAMVLVMVSSSVGVNGVRISQPSVTAAMHRARHRRFVSCQAAAGVRVLRLCVRHRACGGVGNRGGWRPGGWRGPVGLDGHWRRRCGVSRRRCRGHRDFGSVRKTPIERARHGAFVADVAGQHGTFSARGDGQW